MKLFMKKNKGLLFAWIPFLIVAWVFLSWFIQGRIFAADSKAMIAREQIAAQELADTQAESVANNLRFLAGVPDSLQQSARLDKAIREFGSHAKLKASNRVEATNFYKEKPSLDALNKELKAVQDALGVDLLFWVNGSGDCVSASNFASEKTPIGTNFVDREYYKSSLLGKRGVQYAVGRTTHIAGMFFYAPVVREGRFQGVLIAKVNIPTLAFLTRAADIYIADENGVIILAHDKDMVMNTIPDAKLASLTDEVRMSIYAQKDFPKLAIEPWEDSTNIKRIKGEDFPHLLASSELRQYGLTVYAESDLPHMADMENERRANIWVMSLIGTFLIMLGGGGIYYFQLKLSQQQVETEQREFYESLIETLGEGLYVQDSQGRCTYMNAEAERLLGWSRDAFIGMPVHATIHQQTAQGEVLRAEDCPIVALLNESGRFHNEDQVFTHRDGHIFPVEIWSRSIVRNGLNIGGVVAFQDITLRKQAERAIMLAKEDAERASRTKSDFLANMSHEIRTPMNGIIGMTELALDTDLNVEQREYLGMVQSSAAALLTIINDILDFSKIEAGKMDIEYVDFSLPEMCAQTMASIAPRTHQKGLELLLDIAPSVPERVRGDAGRLRQVILNLLGNALKFTDRGEIALHVSVQDAGTDTNSLILNMSVSDTGIGIPAEKLQTIFESFSQADTSTTRKYGGTGLGLTISTRLVELMQGRIRVESEVGKGSTFHIELVLQRAKETEQPTADIQLLQGLRVLVVDDYDGSRAITSALLQRWNMRVTTVATATEAWAELQAAVQAGDAYRILLVDAQLPDGDGYQLVAQARVLQGDKVSALMLLAASGQRGEITRCSEAVIPYLYKPVTASILFDALMVMLGGQSEVAAPQQKNIHTNQQILNILLAEDNSVNQRLATRLLEKFGHRVTVAGNGLIAVESWRTATYDLILMDVDMPEMNGFDATAQIRVLEQGSGKHIPIIGLTAHAMQGSRESCIAAGMDGYLSKPIDTKALWAELEGLSVATSSSDETLSELPEETPNLGFELRRALQLMDNDMSLFDEMVCIYRADYPDYLSRLGAAIATQDAAQTRQLAHTLRGMLSVFDVPEVASLAEYIETQTGVDHSNHYARLAKVLPRLAEVLSDSMSDAHAVQQDTNH